MNRIQRRTCFFGIVTAALAILGGDRVASGQDDVVDDRLVENVPLNEVVQFQMQGNNVVVFNNGVNNAQQQVDQLLFGRFGGAGVARNKLDSALTLRIDDVERSSGVTEVQKKKLQLAGRGDIKRFFDKVEETKRRSAAQTNPQFNNVWQDIQPLQTELNTGLFGESSIFAKTVKRTLSDEQTARYDNVLRQRKLARYHAAVGYFVVQLDKGVGLSHDQRQKLVDLLVKETKPPKRFGQNDYWFMMNQAARLPESSLKPIFDEVQWKLLSRQLTQAKGMRQFLEMNGAVIDDDKPDRQLPVNAFMMAVPLAPAIRIEKVITKGKATEKAIEKKK